MLANGTTTSSWSIAGGWCRTLQDMKAFCAVCRLAAVATATLLQSACATTPTGADVAGGLQIYP